MLIIHENLDREEEAVAKGLRSLYGINSQHLSISLENSFIPIPQFDGFAASSHSLGEFLGDLLKKAVLVLTHRDLYASNKSREDDWVFGYCSGNLLVASTARMKRSDNRPSQTIEVPMDTYLQRITALALHEVGHDVVRNPAFQSATWVNAKTGYEFRLGPHCIDPRCLMYEVVDIRAPPSEEGHLLLGNELRYDAGLDDLLERRYPDWLCNPCRDNLVVEEKYRD